MKSTSRWNSIKSRCCIYSSPHSHFSLRVEARIDVTPQCVQFFQRATQIVKNNRRQRKCQEGKSVSLDEGTVWYYAWKNVEASSCQAHAKPTTQSLGRDWAKLDSEWAKLPKWKAVRSIWPMFCAAPRPSRTRTGNLEWPGFSRQACWLKNCFQNAMLL